MSSENKGKKMLLSVILKACQFAQLLSFFKISLVTVYFNIVNAPKK